MPVSKKLFTGYILSGGKSTRIGKPKPLLVVNGKTLFERALDALRPSCREQINAVIAHSSQVNVLHQVFNETRWICDVYSERGPLGAIHSALADCQTEFAVILAVDLPLVGGGVISELCRTAAASDEFDAFVPKQPGGRLQPLAAVYRVGGCLPVITGILESAQSASVRDFVKAVSSLEIGQASLSDNPDSFLNLNTPDDLARVNLKLGRE